MRLSKYMNRSDLSIEAAAVVGAYVLANVYIIKEPACQRLPGTELRQMALSGYSPCNSIVPSRHV